MNNEAVQEAVTPVDPDFPQRGNPPIALVRSLPGKQNTQQLVEEYYPWIAKRCAQVLGNQSDAHDAAQEVALSMHRGLGRFEGRSSIKTWLGTIVRNECINLIRRNSAVSIGEELCMSLIIYEENQRHSDPLDPVEQDAVTWTLRLLSDDHREVLELRYYKDFSLGEIGETLGISLSAAKMRLHRALAAFKSSYVNLVDSPAGGLPQ